MLKLIPASEYCDNIFDGTHDTPKPKTEGKPLITSKHILKDRLDIANAYNISLEDYNEINKRSRIRQWDILFSMIGTIGNIYLEESNNINYAIKNMGVFSCGNEKKARYLYYYLESNFAKQYINQKLAGAVQKFLSLGELRSFPVPGFDEQLYNSISILSWIDKKIELNNRINTELEVIAKELYNYWFIQFDFPDEFRRPYKSSGGKMVYNDVLKREIPEGWDVLFLEQRLSFERGFECGAEEYTENVDVSDKFVKYYRVGDMDDSGNTFISKHLRDIKLLTPYDLVVSFDGSVGRISFGLCGAYSSGIRKVEDKQKIIDNGVLLFIMASEGIQQTIKKYATGSNILHASASIPHLTIACNEDVLARYQSIIKPIYQQLLAIKLENKRLGELRDFLLPMLMNGQVSVSD